MAARRDFRREPCDNHSSESPEAAPAQAGFHFDGLNS